MNFALVFFYFFHGIDGDPAGHAVVHALAGDIISDGMELGIEDDHVADFDMLFDLLSVHAHVYDKFIDGGNFGSVFGF